MDLKEYFTDFRKIEAKLSQDHPDNIVHVTSKFYRERNSTEGSTASATCRNAARVIADGTHRESSEDEIEAFYEHQQKELEKNSRSEQLKKQQYVVVTGSPLESPNATIVPGPRSARAQRPAPAVVAKDDDE